MQKLSWQHHPFAELLRLAWPIAISTISFTIVTLVDTLLVGRLGTAELAGVGLGGMATFALHCFSFGLLQGAKTLVAQALGAGRREQVIRYIGVALVVGFALGVLTTGVVELASLGIARLAATEGAGRAAQTYMRIRGLGAPIVLVQVALREVLQAQGNARSPMVATVTANVVNVALAVLFIFVLHMGVAGAALAAIISSVVEAAVLVAVQWSRGGFGLHSFERKHISDLLRVGLPTGLQFMLELGSFTTLTLAIASFSETDMAAHQIALQVIHFSFLPCIAAGEAASVLSGQAVGADRDDLVRYIARRAALLAIGYTSLCSIAFLSAGRIIASAFTTDAMVIAVVVQLLRLAGLFQMLDAVNIVARCVLRGTGDVRFAAVFGIGIAWFCTPTLAWGLGHGLKMGALGGWLGIALEVLVAAVILGARVERRGWTRAASESRARMRNAPADGAESSTASPGAVPAAE